MKSRLKELLALGMIGDGILCMAYPSQHLRLWKIGPDQLQETAEEFAQREAITRTLGAVGVVAGLWLASKQYEDTPLK